MNDIDRIKIPSKAKVKNKNCFRNFNKSIGSQVCGCTKDKQCYTHYTKELAGRPPIDGNEIHFYDWNA